MNDDEAKSTEGPTDQQFYEALKSESFRARALAALKSDGFRADVMESVVNGAGLSLVKRLEGAAKYVVPGSVALSVAGFCICVLHYHRRGVPLSALSYLQFVAAGVLYAFLTVSAVAAGLRLGAKSGAKAGGSLIVWSAMLISPIALVSQRGAAFALIYWAALACLTWGMTAAVFWSSMERNWSSASQPASKPYSIVNALFLWFMSTVLFAALIFPNIPTWLGGGALRPVAVVWEAAMAPEEREFLGDESHKRCLFEIHSDQSALYLTSIESGQGGGCPPPPWFHLPSGMRGAKADTFVVVPRSRVRLVIYRRDATP